jgi:hypothetical protein
MEADISGPQRKIVWSTVRPLKQGHGAEGIALRDSKTLPFEVRRSWSAPAGHYLERWQLVNPSSDDVLLEGPSRLARLFGLQAPTEIRDEILEAVDLDPGTYLVRFSLSGIVAGEIEVEAFEITAQEAA